MPWHLELSRQGTLFDCQFAGSPYHLKWDQLQISALVWVVVASGKINKINTRTEEINTFGGTKEPEGNPQVPPY